MHKTIFITGCSSGIGRAIAEFFLEKKWNVVATARDKNTISLEGERLLKLCTDVTDTHSIEKAMQAALTAYGSVDVVVNNAGYGLIGILEEMTEEEILQQFNTNVFGNLRLIQSVLPYMRQNKSGTIINITSMGGRVAFPYYSIYHGTKWAMEGISESLYYELDAIGIRIKVIEPGVVLTDFYGRSMKRKSTKLSEYKAFESQVAKRMTNIHASGFQSSPKAVAKKVYTAATDNRKKLRYTVGIDAKLFTWLKKYLPDSWWKYIIKQSMGT